MTALNEDVDVMFLSQTYFMKNAGEELITEEVSAGQPKITSRGLSVFVNDEEIKLEKGAWRNNRACFNNLEDAVRDAIRRHERCKT